VNAIGEDRQTALHFAAKYKKKDDMKKSATSNTLSGEPDTISAVSRDGEDSVVQVSLLSACCP